MPKVIKDQLPISHPTLNISFNVSATIFQLLFCVLRGI